MTGWLDHFVLVKASKSLGGAWSDDDYIVRDRARNVVVGRIMLHPQAPKGQPWLWTITAREIPESVHNRGYSATREQAMIDFKARWLASTN
jgi:hypothetical protein